MAPIRGDEVLPVRHVVDRIVVARRDIRDRRQVLRRHVGVVVVEPQAVVQRQAVDGPAVLRIDPECRFQVLEVDQRSRVLGDRGRRRRCEIQACDWFVS